MIVSFFNTIAKICTRIPVSLRFLLFLFVFGFTVSGCKSIEPDKDEKALNLIERDIDDFRADLRVLERVRGKPLDREVFIALDDAKRAVKREDYELALDCYSDALSFFRDHLAEWGTITEYRKALERIGQRLEGNVCEGAFDELCKLAVKERLQRVIIPEFSIGPPLTLIDAVDFFKQASRDYDDPDIPVERRGVSFILMLESSNSQIEVEDGDDPFSADPFGNSDVPVVPEISARFISLYDAIGLMCDATGYQFSIRSGLVMITPREEGADE